MRKNKKANRKKTTTQTDIAILVSLDSFKIITCNQILDTGLDIGNLWQKTLLNLFQNPRDKLLMGKTFSGLHNPHNRRINHLITFLLYV